MPTFLFYIIAIIPFVIGGILYATRKEIVWQEWIINSCICFAMAGIFHFLAISGQTSDHETWSGQIVEANYRPAWVEYYEEAIYRTEHYTVRESYTYYTGTGKNRMRHTGYHNVTKSRRVFSHWEPRTRHHSDQYTMRSSLNTQFSIDRNKFDYISAKFNNLESHPGRRHTGEHNSRHVSGDKNDYRSTNKTGWVEPVTKWVAFENKIKAAPTVFSFAQIPKNIENKIYDYPSNHNPFRSDRLVGKASSDLPIFEFDQMNARLGPKKRVNVVVVGYINAPSIYAEYQQSKYIGGKKNDIVIVYSGEAKSPTWVKAFGWTDSKTALRLIEDAILTNGVSMKTMLEVEKLIETNYKPKDWEKAFAHISVPAPAWAMWWYFGIMIVTQVGLWFFYFKNNIGKYGYKYTH